MVCNFGAVLILSTGAQCNSPAQNLIDSVALRLNESRAAHFPTVPREFEAPERQIDLTLTAFDSFWVESPAINANVWAKTAA